MPHCTEGPLPTNRHATACVSQGQHEQCRQQLDWTRKKLDLIETHVVLESMVVIDCYMCADTHLYG